MKKISEEEVNKRLDADCGYLREKIKAVGINALFELVKQKNPPTVEEYDESANRVRFISRCLLDRDGDVISRQNKADYLLRHGIKIVPENLQ